MTIECRLTVVKESCRFQSLCDKLNPLAYRADLPKKEVQQSMFVIPMSLGQIGHLIGKYKITYKLL